jgi:cell division protein FtsI (penicillin-binding protein 3)/stage V sporulation protein D (sporulation-specific penicillin-binding protein)
MKHSDNFQSRIKIIGIGFFLAAGVIVWRLFSLQIVSGDFYKDLADQQYNALKSRPPISYRGSVYFREKSGQLVSAAVVKNGFTLAINPKIFKNPEQVYEKLSSIIPIDREEFLRKAGKENDSYEEIARRLEKEQAEQIKKLNIEGVDIVPEAWRFYPGGNLASHVLGFVGYRGDELVGQYGIEKEFEEFLKGEGDLKENSFGDIFLGLGRQIFTFSREDEKNLVLTIEPRVQSFLEGTLKKIMDDYSAESSGGIIMDPKNGKILAMAAKPDFDPNFYNKVKDPAVFLNPLISNIFEVGSSFKPITLSIALNENKITPETTYIDNGFLILNNMRIENYDAKARGKVHMQIVLNKSLNTGAVFAARRVEKEIFRNYLANFGLSEKTGIELPDEVKGNISSLDNYRDIEYATASFGQGIALTPLGFTAAFAVLGNGGNLVEPYIIETSPGSGASRPKIKRQIIKKETSEEISRMLTKVVDEALLEGTVKLEHYSITAKTGTAQIPLGSKKGYSEDEYLHTFAGYAPSFDARFLVFLYLKKPRGIRYAAYSLGPSFMDIMKFLLNYYEVSPDR